jgi:hypothetical protein
VASLVVSVVSVGVAVGAALFVYKQVAAARVANSLPVVLGLLGEFADTRGERYFITHELAEYPTNLGVWGLPEEAREKVLRVLHYLDHLGLLVDRKLADERAIAGFAGDAIIHLWRCLDPYVRAERGNRRRERGVVDADYQEYFENLAARMLELNPAEIRRGLRTFPDDRGLRGAAGNG